MKKVLVQKLLVLTLSLMMVFSLSACNGGGGDVSTPGNGVSTAADGNQPSTAPDTADNIYGGDWPENEFTRMLPKPNFELANATIEDKKFSVTLSNATAALLKEYVELVKTKGFNLHIEIEEEEEMSIALYHFSAKNEGGWEVVVEKTLNSSRLLISKP